ncbi:hypothetical protein QYF61_002507 [Mycteria americana]|uniref:Uncharacterized protein n=1 Tax=Mycteria americana TaxID=33587 RepID=A0AAN7NPK7_MYCAM|nr:hypothetical protein QYF61_002507 [Mycteria americana]
MASGCAKGGLNWLSGKISSLKGLSSIGTGCPGKWLSHHPWSLHWQSLFPHLLSGWTSRQGLGKQSPSHCKRRSGLRPPVEPEHT